MKRIEKLFFYIILGIVVTVWGLVIGLLALGVVWLANHIV